MLVSLMVNNSNVAQCLQSYWGHFYFHRRVKNLLLNNHDSNLFGDVYAHVKVSAENLGSSGGALFIIHNDKIVTESYFGKQSHAR